MKIKNSKKILLILSAGLLLVGCGGTPASKEPGSNEAGTSENGGGSGWKYDPNKYTYNTYIATKPRTWNPHTWETSDESYVQNFTTMGFYDLQLNSTKDGYEIVTEMASEMPVDVSSSVTSDDAVRFGYKGSIAAGSVWEIALNREACWEDGKMITADDYIESMKRQLDPKMANYRADGYFGSSMVIANAERYFKQGNNSLEEAYKYLNKSNGKWTTNNVCGDGMYYINVEKPTSLLADCFSNVTEPEPFWTLLRQPGADDTAELKLAAERIKDAVTYYCWKFEDHDGDYATDWAEIEGWSKLSSVKEEMLNYDIDIFAFDDQEVYARGSAEAFNEETAVRYKTQDLKADISKVIARYARKTDTSWNWKCPLFVHVYNDYTQTWGDEEGATSGVGLVKVNPYKIKLFLAKPMTALDLKFSLSGNWLVRTDIYDRYMINTGDKKFTKYATPDEGVKSYMSYGPYRLATYESGKEFRIVKNEKWYGYKASDTAHKGQFQMDEIYTRIIQDHDVAVNEFVAGKLDDIDLTRKDMKRLGTSSRLTRTYESYTQKISLNSKRSKLLSRQNGVAKMNKTVLANHDFRKGLSLALDRKNFAAEATAGYEGYTYLLNTLYLTDVEGNEQYRSTTQGKGVYNAVYSQLGGNPFAADYTPTALGEKQLGYNLDMATYYVYKGLRDELESSDEGHLPKGSDTKIDIEFRVYNDESDATKEMHQFIVKAWSKVVGLAVEKLKQADTFYKKDNAVVLTSSQDISINIRLVKDEDYYTSASNGEYDMIFSTWGGASINPRGLMEVYCKKDFTQTCEFGFKGIQDTVKIEIDADGNGTISDSENKSFDAWYSELMDITETDERGTPEYNAKHQRILNIMAGLEAGIINRFEAIPIFARASSSINSFKIENGVDEYINLIGYGGIRHLKFNYTNGEWEEFVNRNLANLESMYKD